MQIGTGKPGGPAGFLQGIKEMKGDESKTRPLIQILSPVSLLSLFEMP
jgi:hypothetical protein